MPDDVFSLFEDYAARFARGERPDVRTYLTRAGPDADDLARPIDGHLARIAPSQPAEDTVAVTNAALHGRSPVREARERRGMSSERVVDALIAALRLDRAKIAKVARYYGELESSARDPSHVDRRVFEVLASTLRTTVSDLLAPRTPPSVEAVTFAWPAPAPAAAPQARARPFTLAARASAPEPPDEIDRLFGE
jgi:hypothetical protein